MGIAVQVNKPLIYGTDLAMFVYSPQLTTANGHPYKECVVVDFLAPRSELKTELVFAPGRMEELRPGRYRLELYSGGKVMHKETFELTP